MGTIHPHLRPVEAKAPAQQAPAPQIDNERLERGLAALKKDGICSEALGKLEGDQILNACALLLGASPAYIAFLSALPGLGQIANIPSVLIIERLKARKAFCIVATLVGRLFYVPLIAVPLVRDHELALGILAACTALMMPLIAAGGVAWTSWTRDLVPERRFGEIFSRRQMLARMSAFAVGICSSLLLPWAAQDVRLYAFIFAFGVVAAVMSTWYLSRMPDVPTEPRPSSLATFARPFRDVNFRQMLVFMGCWNLATSIAAPLYATYMHLSFGLPIALAVVLGSIGVVVNGLAAPFWGRLAGQWSYKTIITFAGSGYLAYLGIMIFMPALAAHMSQWYFLAILLVTQIAFGIITSGLDLALGNIALKLSPKLDSTAYLAVNNLGKSVIGALVLISAGQVITHLRTFSVLGVEIQAWHTVLIFSMAMGVIALWLLKRVKEEIGSSEASGEVIPFPSKR